MNMVHIPVESEAVKAKLAAVNYELFKLNRDYQGDIERCMAHLNRAIDNAPESEWRYLFELSLFIKQVRQRILKFLSGIPIQA